MKSGLRLRPAVIIAISIIIGIVMITSAYLELNQSKGEIYHLLSEQSSSLIEIISLSSINTLNSSYEIEDLITERLLDNLYLIKDLDSLNLLTRDKLIQIGRKNHLYRINIFDKDGNRILSNRVPEPGHVYGPENVNRMEELKPILKGHEKEYVIGYKQSEYSNEQRFAVAIARAYNKGAIVANLDAKDLLEFRKKIGIGKIIQDIADNQGIEFIVLQDTLGILAASASVDSMSSIESDRFLIKALHSDSVFYRTTSFKNREVYEVVKRLDLDGDVLGLYRIGLSLDEIREVESRMSRHAIMISIILTAISIIVLSIVFTQQNLKTVSNEFSKFKTLTSSVLENMTEAVIVVDPELNITLFNKSSENLFHLTSVEVTGKRLSKILNGKFSFISDSINELGDNFYSYFENDIEFKNNKMNVSVSITKNLDDKKDIETYTIVIQDLTETKKLEEQANRREKLSAMGELASGVAHEIRNPINSIGIIAQRLYKEFLPHEDGEEYKKITKVLRDEVDRINKIITQFLNYAKPLDVNLKTVDSKDYFDEIITLFRDQAKSKKIDLNVNSNDNFPIKTDPGLIKQALINIIQNSIDAINGKGKITIGYFRTNNNLVIEISDNGPGIPENIMQKIFELYFTTKNDGNGLGLSISQKIIAQLNGTIEFESKLNKGTKFTIKLPIV